MANAKILVVDDDQDIRESLQAILEGQKYSVITAADPATAKGKMKTEKPDLLILDVMLSTRKDGFDMARELKNDPHFKDTPILMLTGIKQKTGIDFKSMAGDPTWCPVDGFLDKPFKPDILLREVGKLLKKKAAEPKNDVKVQFENTPKQYKFEPKLSTKELMSTISFIGKQKASTKVWQLFLLGILAGLYIGFGGHLFLVALAEGMGKVVGGAVFSIGLVLVVVAGAELFTGNIIMLIGTLATLFPFGRMIRNWATVYAGNFAGAFIFALLVWKSGLLGAHGALNDLGILAVKVAEAKLAISFQQCLIRGVFCNMLVILAIIMTIMSKDIISKILCCVLPIMTFVACGFEHCVANMFLIPIGLFAKGIPIIKQVIIFRNILPVTLGNIIGGLLILLLNPNIIQQISFLLRRYRKK